MTDEQELPRPVHEPRQNRALQSGGGTSLGIGGSLGVVLAWLADLAGIPMSAEVGAALGAVMSFVVSVVVSDS